MIFFKPKVKAPPDPKEMLRRKTISFIDRVGSTALRAARAAAPKDTGHLVNSIHLVREYRPPFMVGGIQTNLPYAVVQEEGRRPGQKWPPLLPIMRWVVRHRLAFGIGGGIEGTRKLVSVTYLVRRKIGRLGVPGKKFFKAAERAVRRAFGAEVAALGLDIKRSWDAPGTA